MIGNKRQVESDESGNNRFGKVRREEKNNKRVMRLVTIGLAREKGDSRRKRVIEWKQDVRQEKKKRAGREL